MTVARSGRRGSSVNDIIMARFWKLRPPSDSTGESWNIDFGSYAATLFELQMFSSSDATGTDITTGQTISAPYDPGTPQFADTMLIDDDLLTRWSTINGNTIPASIVLDFGSPVSIGSLTILPFDAILGIHPKNYILEYSDDDIGYTIKTTISIPNVITLITITDL